MPRKKPELNVYQRFAAKMPPYDRLAGRILFGEYDIALVAKGYEIEPVTDPRLVRWIDTLLDIDKRGDKTSLIGLLESDCELLPVLHRLLTDLLFRHRLTKKPDATRATPYERRVLVLLKLLDDQPYGREASEIRRELDDLMSWRKLLARMIARYDFVRRGGKQFTAAYDMTAEDARQHARYQGPDQEVTGLIKQGWALLDAVNNVAKKASPLNEEFAAGLEAYHKKEQGSLHRKEKRRKY